jgi:bifunctional DNA-binding transcriptional regulator/antitoxin component of YhaV-PrlF toxin-antitoxin module
MLLSKLTANAQTTIPQAVRTALDLQEGDYVRYIVEDRSVRLMKLSKPVVSQEHAAIPEEVRASLGLHDGDAIKYSFEGDKVIVTKLPKMNMKCSFCGKAIARPETPVPGAPPAPKLAVAGANVFICRDCVGMCISSMGGSDPQWRDEQVEHLAGFATGETQKKIAASQKEQMARFEAALNGEPASEPRDTPPHQDEPPSD